jgi:hypothetical protein
MPRTHVNSRRVARLRAWPDRRQSRTPPSSRRTSSSVAAATTTTPARAARHERAAGAGSYQAGLVTDQPLDQQARPGTVQDPRTRISTAPVDRLTLTSGLPAHRVSSATAASRTAIPDDPAPRWRTGGPPRPTPWPGEGRLPGPVRARSGPAVSPGGRRPSSDQRRTAPVDGHGRSAWLLLPVDSDRSETLGQCSMATTATAFLFGPAGLLITADHVMGAGPLDNTKCGSRRGRPPGDSSASAARRKPNPHVISRRVAKRRA